MPSQRIAALGTQVTPADATSAALDEAGRLRADVVMSGGGGSAIGLRKAAHC